jgi:hypothetical protein
MNAILAVSVAAVGLFELLVIWFDLSMPLLVGSKFKSY